MTVGVRITLVGAILQALLIPPAASGQPALPPADQVADAPPTRRLSLEEALARAADASHRLGELRAREAGSAAVVEGRRVADRPLLALQAGYLRTNHIDEFGVALPDGRLRVIFPDLPNNYRTRLDLSWPIYSGGRTDALERAAEAELRATGHDLAAVRADLRLEVTRAYWALVTARESVRVLDEAVRRVDEQLRDARSRLDAGLIPPNEVLSVEAERSHQTVLLIEAQNTREVVASELRRLTGIADEMPIEPDALLDAPASGSDTAAALLAGALQARPERQALQDRVAAAASAQEAAAAGRRPAVALGGGLDYARPNPRFLPREDTWRHSWDVSVSVTWALWDAGRTRAESAQAAAGREALEERLAEFDSVLALEIRQRLLDLESARAAATAAADGVRSAAEARRVVLDRFDAGVATSLDGLTAQVALLQAELERTRALANVRLARARLDRALGR
jgi:outer membrane protein TolC